MAQDKKVAMEATPENLAKIVGEIRTILVDVVRAIAPATPLDDATKTRLESFQTWVGRIAQGDENASLGYTLGNGIKLRRMIKDNLRVFFGTSLEGFVNLAKLIEQQAPALFSQHEQEIAEAIGEYGKVAGSDDFVKFVVPYNRCHDVLIPLRAKAEAVQRDAELAARKKRKAHDSAKAIKALADFADLQVA